MDRYDYLILKIIDSYKKENANLISLSSLESTFWRSIEHDVALNIGQAKIGERITNLYLNDLIQNKNGYTLTKKGREALSYSPADIAVESKIMA